MARDIRFYCLPFLLTVWPCRRDLRLSAKDCSRSEFASGTRCNGRGHYRVDLNELNLRCCSFTWKLMIGARTLLRHRSVQESLYFCILIQYTHFIAYFQRVVNTGLIRITDSCIPTSYGWFSFLSRRYNIRRIATNIELPTREIIWMQILAWELRKCRKNTICSPHWQVTVSTTYIEDLAKHLILGRLRMLVQWQVKTWKKLLTD